MLLLPQNLAPPCYRAASRQVPVRAARGGAGEEAAATARGGGGRERRSAPGRYGILLDVFTRPGPAHGEVIAAPRDP